jgi:cyanophycinase
MFGDVGRCLVPRLGAVLAIFALAWVPAEAGRRLVLVGGGERPQAAMARFVTWAGGERARILVISWATEYPGESFDYFKQEVLPLRPAAVDAAPPRPLTTEGRTEFLAQLGAATGVFFTGGDQGRIMDVLADAALADALRARYEAGVVFGGTSAGTAIMSPIMITGNGNFDVLDGSQVETRPGLGLMPGTIVDQHFIARRRQNRLFGLVLRHPDSLGIGVDEDTALLVEDNRYAEVVGTGRVVTVDARSRNGSLLLYVLEPGRRFDLRKRAPLRSK